MPMLPPRLQPPRSQPPRHLTPEPPPPRPCGPPRRAPEVTSTAQHAATSICCPSQPWGPAARPRSPPRCASSRARTPSTTSPRACAPRRRRPPRSRRCSTTRIWAGPSPCTRCGRVPRHSARSCAARWPRRRWTWARAGASTTSWRSTAGPSCCTRCALPRRPARPAAAHGRGTAAPGCARRLHGLLPPRCSLRALRPSHPAAPPALTPYPAQIRHMIGGALAVAHGLVPAAVFDAALRSPFLVDVSPLAPGEGLALLSNEFFNEKTKVWGRAVLAAVLGAVLCAPLAARGECPSPAARLLTLPSLPAPYSVSALLLMAPAPLRPPAHPPTPRCTLPMSTAPRWSTPR